MSAVLLEDVKAHLGIRTDTRDDDLQKVIDAAEGRIAKEVGPLAPTAFTERVAGGRSSLLLQQQRVLALVEVAYSDTVPVPLADLEVDAGGVVHMTASTSASRFRAGVRNVVVTYTAGFDPLPPDLEHAVKEMVRHLWEPQRGGGSGPGARAEALGATGDVPVSVPYTLPSRVRELIAPYVLQTQVL